MLLTLFYLPLNKGFLTGGYSKELPGPSGCEAVSFGWGLASALLSITENSDVHYRLNHWSNSRNAWQKTNKTKHFVLLFEMQLLFFQTDHYWRLFIHRDGDLRGVTMIYLAVPSCCVCMFLAPSQTASSVSKCALSLSISALTTVPSKGGYLLNQCFPQQQYMVNNIHIIPLLRWTQWKQSLMTSLSWDVSMGLFAPCTVLCGWDLGVPFSSLSVLWAGCFFS